ncbi:hypothetical protein MN032_01500 [Agromyces atrinae]|uniref:hypothetical protein n=1 Tax=Agromyces atrinae TaxID=592376 RepID=UPI001F57C4CE|nr:hypothetical protein [Agromyces atrinae]MCI2956352.1 hypothetical protein [Agromyces atrinae]
MENWTELDACLIPRKPLTAMPASPTSSFFRDGIWIATHWVNTGPDGYTHNIVPALFG